MAGMRSRSTRTTLRGMVHGATCIRRMQTFDWTQRQRAATLTTMIRRSRGQVAARLCVVLLVLLVAPTRRPLEASLSITACLALKGPHQAAWVPRNVRIGDARVRASLQALLVRSTLVREMLAFIGRTDDALLTLRGNAGLVQRERVGGLTTIGRVDDALVIYIDIDLGDGAASVAPALLAHELAHAVEVLALPRVPIRRLGNLLLARQGRHVPWSPAMRFETAFAEAVEKAVSLEIASDAPSAPGRLGLLLARHGLSCAPPGPRAAAR